MMIIIIIIAITIIRLMRKCEYHSKQVISLFLCLSLSHFPMNFFHLANSQHDLLNISYYSIERFKMNDFCAK